MLNRAANTPRSCGRESLALKSMAVVKTTRAPMVEVMVAMKAYDQYVVSGSMMAKRRQEIVVAVVPAAETSEISSE